MGKYFGTDGFRGEANVGLTVDHAFRIGRYLGWYYSQGHKAKVVIGKDTRRSSYMFENALCAGLTASGADAYLLHVTSTPSVSFIARADDFDCGIMISASHNPYYDNGIKLLNGDGEKMEESVLDGIEEYLDSDRELPYATRDAIGCTVDYAAGRNRYIGYLISLATRSYKRYRIGLDCANGSTWQMAKSVFDALGADTYVIGNHPDGLNINVDCGSTHLNNLKRFERPRRRLRLRRRRGPLPRRGREGQRGQRRPYHVPLRKVYEGKRQLRRFQGRHHGHEQHGPLQGAG